MEKFEQQIKTLQGELKGLFDKAAEEQKQFGTMLTETKTKIDALQKQVDALDVKLADKHQVPAGESLEDFLKKDDGIQRIMRDKSGSTVITLKGNHVRQLLGRKSVVTATAAGADLNPVGTMTTGVLQIDRIPGITVEARQALKIRDLLYARPTIMQLVDFVKVTSAPTTASPAAEASDKPENAVTFQSKSEKIRTIATWIPASRQVLDDFQELLGYLQTALPYYVNLTEEVQLLSGDSTGENLDGLITQAQAFETGLLTGNSWNRIDIIGRAIEQINNSKEIQPTFVVMHPTDWWNIRLTKDGFGRYILGDPQTDAPPNIFGLDVAYTTSMGSGSFLVGSGNPVAAEIRDRMEMQVEIATQHASFFTQNLIAIRAEKRMALVVKRPNSYISGTFTTSPAS